MKRPRHASEAELAKQVITLLERQGWTIYQEVDALAGRADIVAVKGRLVHVVECKLSFGFAVLEQARRWLPHANLVSLATAPSHQPRIAEEVCRWLGLGWISAWVGGAEVIAPRLHRGRGDKLRARLRPEHQQFGVAGSNQGGYYTPFKKTCTELVAYLRRRGNPEVLKELVRQVPHHYPSEASARRGVREAIERQLIPEARLEYHWGARAPWVGLVEWKLGPYARLTAPSDHLNLLPEEAEA